MVYVTVLAQACGIVLAAAFQLYSVVNSTCARKNAAPPWAQHLLLSAKTKSRIELFNLLLIPPFCTQAILGIDDLHNSPFIQVHKRLIQNKEPIDNEAGTSEVLMLDPADEEPETEITEQARMHPEYPPAFLRTRVPTEETLKRADGVNVASVCYITIRRLPKGYNKDGTTDIANNLAEVVVEMV